MAIYNKDPFYHKSVRNMVAAFGTLFNNIKIVRKDSNDTEVARYSVPLVYGTKNTWYKRLLSQTNTSDPDNTTNINFGNVLPVMTFRMGDIAPAPERKTNRMNKIHTKPTSGTVSSMSYNPIPIDIQFELQVFTKNLDDGLQIIEQIIPFFQPSIALKVKEIQSPEIINDVVITFNGVSHDDAIETWEDSRLVTWNMAFTLAGNMYPSISPTNIITNNIIDIYDLNTDEILSTVQCDVDDL